MLVGWKEIAAQMKCSVRKVQRLEHAGLPVNRIPGAKSVWASRSELDRWLTLQAEKAKQQPKPETQVVVSPLGLSRSAVAVRLSVIAVLFLLTVRAWMASVYGLTTLLFSMTAAMIVVSYPCLPDRRWIRAIPGLFLTAGMAYATTATSLPGVVHSVANMETLPPALAYPVAAGLRFIPVPVALCVCWVFIGLGSDATRARTLDFARAFAGLGLAFLCMTAGAGLVAFARNPIWQSGLSIRWTLLAGECAIVVLNGGLLWFGYRLLNGTHPGDLRLLLASCGAAYLLIALTAATMNRHWNDINERHLDVRWPLEYRVVNPQALADVEDWMRSHASEVGPDLARLPSDPEFIDALQNGKFYRVEFDESFQLSQKAVVLGYHTAGTSHGRESVFRLVRFPLGLAKTLQLNKR
jgi:hypothetical protein